MAYCEKAKGIVNVLIDNVSFKLSTDSDLEISATKQQREEMSNGEFSVNEVSPYIQGEFKLPCAQSLKAVQEVCAVSVLAELFDGRVFLMQRGSSIPQGGYMAKTNTIELRFIGEAMEEISGCQPSGTTGGGIAFRA